MLEGYKEDRYKNKEGKDLIDQWWEEYSIEECRILMFEQMRKYKTRLGKKDNPVSEVEKIANYASRWLEKEKERVQLSLDI